MAQNHAAQHPLASHALVERRAFIRRAALVAGGASMFGIGAGCSNDVVARSATSSLTATSTTSTTLTPEVYGSTLPYWMQGNYAPVAAETVAVDLEVSGRLPAGLAGLYARNGSNPAGDPSPHWFLGDGMVHGVRLDRGRATWYGNRYVQTPQYTKRTDFMGSGAPGGAVNQSNVSIFAHGGKLLTSGEVGLPYELSPNDLSTIGVHDYDGALRTAMTAHPKIDPDTGQMHFFGYGFVPPYLSYHVVDADGTLISSQEVAVPGPTMIHDFAITDRDVVFWDLPVVFDMDLALAALSASKSPTAGGDSKSAFPFRWDTSYGARIGIMALGGSTTDIRWVEIEPCYVFHGVNAYRDGDDVVVEVCRLPSMFSAEPDRRPEAIHRWRINTAGEQLTFSDERISEQQMDLPALDRRETGRAHRNAWYLDVETNENGVGEFAGLTRLESATGAMDRYVPGERYRLNEGTFVADGNGDDGWLLSFAIDRARGASDLMVFDSHNMAGGPVATVHLPTLVPYGFHGWWLPDELSA